MSASSLFLVGRAYAGRLHTADSFRGWHVIEWRGNKRIGVCSDLFLTQEDAQREADRLVAQVSS